MQIITEAHADADEIRRGADEYAVGVLVGLEGDVVKTLQSIKKGIAAARRAARIEEIETGEANEAGPDARWEDETVEPSQAGR